MQSTIPSVSPEAIAPEATAPAPVKAARRRRSAFRIGAEVPRAAYSLVALTSFALVLAAWFAASHFKLVSPLILPAPGEVVATAARQIGNGSLWADTLVSVTRIGLGFAASAILAIPLGILIGAYKPIEAAQEPLVSFIRYVPVPALIPLVMVAAGIGESAKVLLIFIGTYFQMVLVVADVTRQVPRDLINAARTLGASPKQQLLYVLLPATVPGLLDTCRVMLGWAWTYLVIAEVVATDSGLGYRIMKAQRFLRTDEIFLGILVLGLLGLATDLFFKILQPRLTPWAEVQRS
jgi:NitT/TauT family transport system permease protein